MKQKCSKCGTRLFKKGYAAYMLGERTTVPCPKCGKVQMIAGRTVD